MVDCLFCKIGNGSIPAKTVFENGSLVAFQDISPQAPTHILIIPKEHISTLNDVNERHKSLLGNMILIAKELAEKEGISESGYRTVFNCQEHGGQTVNHIHLHLLGGRQMKWPPG